MDSQTKKTDLTRENIREMIKDLEPGTMLTLEMPDMPDIAEAVYGMEKKGGADIHGRPV